MTDGDGVRGVVLAHGEMARGMVDAVARIAGLGNEGLVAVSNEGESTESLRTRLDTILGDDEAIIFVDLGTGSCATAARYACRERPGRCAVFGVNLPVLIDFVFHRNLPLDELVDRVREKGRGAMTVDSGDVEGP